MILTWLQLIATFTTLCFVISLSFNQRKLKREIGEIKLSITRLTNSSEDFAQHLQEKVLEEQKARYLLMIYQQREAIAKQQNGIHPKALEDLLPIHYNDSELITLFSPKQLLIMKQYLSAVETYLSTYWMTHDHKIKTVFKGRPNDRDSEPAQLQQASKLLVKKLDHWLTQLNSSS